MLTLLAAAAKNGIIGKNNKTPWYIPEEMALFKELTMGHACIIGRKTYESIGHELPNRTMYILSRSPHPNPPFCSSIEHALAQTKNEQKTFVIGGGQVYAQMMPFADEMRISHLKQEYQGDVYFPIIDLKIWKIVEQKEYPLFIYTRYIRI